MATYELSSTASMSLLSATTTPSLAYVTFLRRDGEYDVKAVVGLAKSLRKVQSKHRLVVAVLPQVREEQRQILVSQGCIVREINHVHLPENSGTAYNVDINCSAIRIWEFLDYDKMVYLNADVQVHNNIDHLFHYPDDDIFFATMKCFCATEDSHGPHFCPHSPDKVQWDTKKGPNPPVYFDAGMFVFKPSSVIYHGLFDTLKNTNVGFQDLLNLFFNKTHLPLPFMYNFNLAMILHHPEHELDKVKVVSYCDIESKPWMYNGEQLQQIMKLLEKWWEIYNDESLDYNNSVAFPE